MKNIKTLLALLLFSVLILCAEKRVCHVQDNAPSESYCTNDCKAITYCIKSLQVPLLCEGSSNSNYITERTPLQYSRVRKIIESAGYTARYKIAPSVSTNEILNFNEVHTGLRYACAREYFIYTLNRLRI